MLAAAAVTTRSDIDHERSEADVHYYAIVTPSEKRKQERQRAEKRGMNGGGGSGCRMDP